MRCPACGNLNREGARFCDSCGTLLGGEGDSPAPAVGTAGPGSAAAGRVGELPPEAPAAIAGRYELVGYLGRGGRKRVYLAHDREAGGRQVAISLFETEGIGAAAAARARREAHAMERLGNHPRIAAVIASGEHEGAPYLVSEYMPGGDLGARLAEADRGRLEPAEAIAIATDVCRALEHAHGHGIVHRDLKPANVWVGADGRARLGDFGLAATERRSREAAAGTLVGTVAYLPPEQALGRAVDGRADLYSLGALLYEMVTGQPPFTGEDALVVISRHVNSEPVAPRRLEPTVPPALDRLIVALLAKSPDERPSSAAGVRAELEAIAADPGREAPDQPADDPVAGLAGGTFVGREREFEEMRAGVDGALAGRGGVLLLAGEPGIGKTRAAEELATYARVRGARVIWGRAHDAERAPAFWPWIDAIREFVRDADPVGLRWQLGSRGPELARIVREIAELLGIEARAEDPDDEQSRFRLFDAVAGFLADAAASRPLVVALDDLHWADPSSLELLGFVSRRASEAGLLLVGTYRDVELGREHGLARTLEQLAAAEQTSTIRLGGLDERAVGAMIEASTGRVLPKALVRSIWERTEGNPFFVDELVRVLAAQDALDAGDAELPVVIPEGVRETVSYRLARLPDEALEVLRVAAVLGKEFEAAAVEAASGRSAGEVAGALGEAMDARVVAEAGTLPGWLSFAHAIVRETIYAEMDSAERARLHLRLGEVIEELHADDLGPYVADLARHFALGGGESADKAIEYARSAGERALGQFAYEDAAAQYARALELIRERDGEEAEGCLELAMELGRARTLAGRFAEARDAYELAAELARKRGDVGRLTRAVLGISQVSVAGRVDEPLLALLEEALRANPRDSVTRVEILCAVAQQVVWRDPAEAAAAGGEALEIARRLGEDQALAFALAIQQPLTAARPDAPRARLANAEELIEVAERCGNAELAIRGYAFRLHSLLELGDTRAAEDEALAGYARVANELRQPHHLWHLPLFRAARATLEGRFAEAEALADEAHHGGERAQEPLAGQLHALQIAVIRQLQGRLEEAVPAVREMARRFPAIRAWRLTLASFLAELGSEEEARAEFERQAADSFASLPRDLQWLPGMIRLADTAHWLGDAERARILYDEIAPFAGLAVVVGRAASVQGPVDLYLARLALTMGDVERAIAHAEDAIALARRMGDRVFLPEARYTLGRALERRGGAGDRDRALEELTACLDDADSLGLRRLLERALVARLEVQGLGDIDVLTSIEAVVEAVGSERPDLSSLGTDGRVTILFSDIENSSLINERLGDARWLEVLREHNTIFRRRLDDHGGYEVKSQGDGFMLAFGDPAAALRFAVAVQRDLGASEVAGAEGISVRMGIHSGEAIAEEGDLFGRSVVLAARIAAQARGGEILVSEALSEECEGREGEYSFDTGRDLELKGLAGTHRVYRVEFEDAPAAV